VLVAREREALIEQVTELVKREDVDTVVVGVPYGLSGSLTPQTSWVLEIIDEMRARLDVSIVTLDERLTTREAHAVMRNQGISTRDKEAADEIAARILLETYLRGESD
jgi:putative Holliday junction resolvase